MPNPKRNPDSRYAFHLHSDHEPLIDYLMQEFTVISKAQLIHMLLDSALRNLTGSNHADLEALLQFRKKPQSND